MAGNLTYSAYVTWRADHDDFFVTKLDLGTYNPDWSSWEWVSLAADAEDESDCLAGGQSYELLSVMVVPYGTQVSFAA